MRGGRVGGCSGRQVVGQLDESQSAVETLALLLEPALGGAPSLAALLLLHGLLLFVRLDELHGILLLLVLGAGLALRLGLGGCRGALLTGLPVPAWTEESVTIQNQRRGVQNTGQAMQIRCVAYFASHSATALLSTDWAFPRPSFGSSLFRREKGCLGQWRLACVNLLPHPAEGSTR